jgi:3-hydroxybutyryl-CoA dehydrogenase
VETGTDRFAHTTVIGTGMMGPGIALALAQGGCQVALYGRTPESTHRGLARLTAALSFLVDTQIMAADTAHAIRQNVHTETDLATAVQDAGLVVESIIEDLAAKRALFAQLGPLCGVQTLFTSDTSGLLITDITAGLPWADRCATTHFWNPPHLMPLVEITQGAQTSDATVDALVALLRRCGKAPVVARKDVPGQIANRFQHALLREAIFMIQEGIASAEDIDTALKLGPGRRWPVYGLLEHQDMVGLDLALAVQQALVPSLCRADAPLPYLLDLVRAGNLGVKTGHGLYDWTQRSPAALAARRDAFLCMLARDWSDDADVPGKDNVPGS